MAIRRKKFHRGKKRHVREHRLNEEITEPRVRMIEEGGAKVLPTSEAIQMAKDAGVDLVEIAKGQDPPIVRVIDYGRFKFEKAKKDKESKKHQRTIQVKEVKMGPKIDVGDFDRKCQMAVDFLEEGDNVKVSMRFKGREMAHTELGLEKMHNVIAKLEGIAVVEKEPKLEGRMATMVLRPKGKKITEKPQGDSEKPGEEPPQSS